MVRLILIFCLAFSLPARAESVTVAAAISLKNALSEIAAQYKTDTGDTVDFAFGSSGQLLAQIKNGAPIDAFVSAAPAQIEALDKANLIDPDTRRTIATNTLVLIVPAAAPAPPRSFEDLTGRRFKRIAIGQPKTVPAGEYARQTLEALKLADALKDRLVYGSNVRQVLDYVARGEVDAGVVYSTDARQGGDKVKVVASADASTHDPILYPAAVVRASSKQAAAKRFLDYLAAEKALAILKSHGFTIPTKAARSARHPDSPSPSPTSLATPGRS